MTTPGAVAELDPTRNRDALPERERAPFLHEYQHAAMAAVPFPFRSERTTSCGFHYIETLGWVLRRAYLFREHLSKPIRVAPPWISRLSISDFTLSRETHSMRSDSKSSEGGQYKWDCQRRKCDGPHLGFHLTVANTQRT